MTIASRRVASVNEEGIKRIGRVSLGGRGRGPARRDRRIDTQGVLKRVLSIIEIARGLRLPGALG